MKHIKSRPNVFLVNTPHQLLNAIEAVHSFQLTNNHLLVMRPKSSGQDRFTPLIKTADWATVSFPSPFINSKRWVQKLFGSVANRWYCRYLHFHGMHTLAKLAAKYQYVDHLFLGHYFAEEKPFMRHIANTVNYNTLCLLDDGTDTIEINKRRQGIGSNEREAQIDGSIIRPSVFTTIKARLRAKYWDWHLAEAPSVTFFSIYDIDVRKGDRLIRNDYSYLRSLASPKHVHMADTVIFIGQCIADGYFELNAHFAFLAKVKEYFAGKRLVYVAHPRESASYVTQIREQLQCEIWPSSSVIEQELIIRGIKPKVVAGFVSSALITLAYLMDEDVEVVCFHIGPEHWLGWREDAVGVYNYLRTKAQQRVTIVSLSGQESECN
jgi:hypothetical protein